MRHLAFTALFVLAMSSAVGCGAAAPAAPSTPENAPDGDGASTSGASATGSTAAMYQIPQASKDLIRQREKAAYERSEQAEDDALDKQEKDALKALSKALGKTPSYPGGPVPESSSTTALALRKSPIKVRLEPITDADGNPVGDDFFQLKDSYTDRAQQLQRKLVEQRASKAELRELQSGAKYMMKVSDLRMAVMGISTQARTSNFAVQSQSMQTMLKISGMVRSRKMMDMDFDEDDYARVKRSLERMRRSEAIAASTMGMLAAYQAVLNNGGDPHALDAIADNSLKAFPLKPTVTDDEAKEYVADLKGNVAAQKAKYEQMMRKTYGDAKYEKTYKQSIDTMFKQAEGAQDQKSTGQMMQDRQAKYMDDLQKCARGQKLDSGTMVGAPSVDRCRARLQELNAPVPDAPAGSGPGGGAASGGGSAGMVNGGGMPTVPDPRSMVPGRVTQGMGVAGSIANGDVSGALDGAAKMFPSDGTIGSSLAGISALTKGDPRGAINAALSMVPGGGLVKDGLSFAANLLFGSSKKG